MRTPTTPDTQDPSLAGGHFPHHLGSKFDSRGWKKNLIFFENLKNGMVVELKLLERGNILKLVRRDTFLHKESRS